MILVNNLTNNYNKTYEFNLQIIDRCRTGGFVSCGIMVAPC